MIQKPAFTLIELLIVITIIGILAVALLPSVLGAPGRARDAQRKADLKNIAAAIEAYQSDKGDYPLAKKVTACIGDDDTLGINKYFSGGKPPLDPQKKTTVFDCANGKYAYCRSDGSKFNYYLVASVELPGDATFIGASHGGCDSPLPSDALAERQKDKAVLYYGLQR